MARLAQNMATPSRNPVSVASFGAGIEFIARLNKSFVPADLCRTCRCHPNHSGGSFPVILSKELAKFYS